MLTRQASHVVMPTRPRPVLLSLPVTKIRTTSSVCARNRHAYRSFSVPVLGSTVAKHPTRTTFVRAPWVRGKTCLRSSFTQTPIGNRVHYADARQPSFGSSTVLTAQQFAAEGSPYPQPTWDKHEGIGDLLNLAPGAATQHGTGTYRQTPNASQLEELIFEFCKNGHLTRSVGLRSVFAAVAPVWEQVGQLHARRRRSLRLMAAGMVFHDA